MFLCTCTYTMCLYLPPVNMFTAVFKLLCFLKHTKPSFFRLFMLLGRNSLLQLRFCFMSKCRRCCWSCCSCRRLWETLCLSFWMSTQQQLATFQVDLRNQMQTKTETKLSVRLPGVQYCIENRKKTAEVWDHPSLLCNVTKGTVVSCLGLVLFREPSVLWLSGKSSTKQ